MCITGGAQADRGPRRQACQLDSCLVTRSLAAHNDIIFVTNWTGDTVRGVLEYRLVELEIYFGNLFL